MTTDKLFTTKLGTARKIERSRIWIEGARLIAAGFTVGQYFHKEWVQDPKRGLILTLVKDDDVMTQMPCKVSGKGEKPIIDITGADVREAFPYSTHVTVQYEDGKITIRAAE